MASSGRQIAGQNVLKFNLWLASKTDDDFRQMVNREGVLSRREIVAQCGIGSSAINQNPSIKAALLAVENDLRTRQILPPLANQTGRELGEQIPLTSAISPSRSYDADRLRRLEMENAILKAENGELKRQIEKFGILREVLSNTGRLAR